MMKRRVQSAAVLMVLLAMSSRGGENTILGSKHDLSAAGPGPIRATSESEVCLFCHTPHSATADTPLWNRALSQAAYIPYSSSTTKAAIGQPTGASKLCLSCHDGTVALGMVNTRPVAIDFAGGITRLPLGPSNLGTDLSDDHPVSFVYDSALAATKGEMRNPLGLTGKVKVDDTSQMQCTSCHDPHSNEYGKFLVQDNRASALCLTCHEPQFWPDTSHKLSVKTWNGTGTDPWPNTSYSTVADNACENCHAPHKAGTKPRLLAFADEEKNCFSCHSGTVATKNIEREFTKFSGHPIYITTGVHDPTEDVLNPPRHVECADCHNPHAANGRNGIVPNASGALAGVTGISRSGSMVSPVKYEYELCFRCHADSASRGQAKVNRQFPVTNTRLEFQPSNRSYHPVLNPSPASSSPSLLAQWRSSSRIYCTDCHNNDQGPNAGGTGPNGPHGSTYPSLLERQLITADKTPENAGAYALCYKCHSRNSILSDESFNSHRFHIVDQRTPCTTCHDPHGVASNKHLINFNVDYVTPSSNGRLEYVSNGPKRGNCSLTCHGSDHRAKAYTPITTPPQVGQPVITQ